MQERQAHPLLCTPKKAVNHWLVYMYFTTQQLYNSNFKSYSVDYSFEQPALTCLPSFSVVFYCLELAVCRHKFGLGLTPLICPSDSRITL